MTMDELLNSQQFKQALFDVQTKESMRLMAAVQRDKITLIPGDGGRNCPGNGEHRDADGNLIEICCDECDYLMCCMEDESQLESERH